MKNIRIDNLSAEAKSLVEFYNSMPNLRNVIYITTKGCIIDNVEWKNVKDMNSILEELKQNGNITSYTYFRIDDQKVKFVFDC